MKFPFYHKAMRYARLMRLDRPIGWLLLLWPTWLALWGSTQGKPSLRGIVVFTLGVIVMRSAGCVINDWADRHVDGSVKRTCQRPIVSHQVDEKEALSLFALLLVVAFFLVCFLNKQAMVLSGIAVVLAMIYPFMKRYTHFPQVILGAAFAWGIPMAYVAETKVLAPSAGVLFFATILWTMAFDTIYAIVDREDDIKIGIKSTAIAFGDYDLWIVGGLQASALLLFGYWGKLIGLSYFYAIGFSIAVGLSCYQQWMIRTREPEACFRAFLNSHWIGAILFIGMCLDLY